MKSYQLMPNQHQYLCRHFLVQDRTQLNTPIILKIRSNHLEVQEIKKTVKQVLNRHTAFHTILYHNGQEVVQRIDENMEIDIVVHQGIPDRQDQYISEFVKPFPMMNSALVRVALYQYNRSEYLLLFDSIHLIMDGISKTIFIRDLIQNFNGAVPAEQTDAYLSFLERFREYSQSKLHSMHKRYWTRQLNLANINEEGHGSPRYRFDDSADGSTVCEFSVDRVARERIQILAKEKQVTPYIVFLSALAYLMQNTLHLKTIVISGVFSIRQYYEMEMVGQCTNTLPVIYTPDKQQSILAFIDAYRTIIAEVHQNLEYPLLNYHQLLHSDGMELTYNTLLETLLIYHNYAKKNNRLSTPAGEFELVDYFQFPKPLGMEINICEMEDDKYRIFLNFNNSFYPQEKRKIIVDTYRRLLLNLTEANTQHRDICDSSKIDWLRYEELVPVHKQFEKLVGTKLSQTALIAESKSITYGQLENKARSVACFLQTRGIQKGDIVVLVLNRSIDVLSCILGVLKLGAVFVIMNREYGEHRIQTMISQLDVKLILCDTPINKGVLLDGIPKNGMAPIECIDIEPSDPAYIMFTSGSTGVPKPVLIQHGALSNTFQGMSQALNLDHTHMFLAASNISFDVSLIEMLWPLLNDKQVFIETGFGYRDPKRIGELVRTYKPDILQITPSLLKLFLKQDPDIFSYLNCLLIGGEIVTHSVMQELSKYFQHGRAYNLYGLTELAIWSTVKELQLNAKLSITAGLPICNTKIYILDQNCRIQKTNTEGSVCITGFSLGSLTSQDEERGRRFSIPELGTARLYNTGDVGFIDSKGELTVLGRMDNEIKYHGLRIQPIEIENVLSSIPAIHSALVVMQGSGINQKLTAYLVLERSITVQEIQAKIEYKLPPAFIPSLYFQIEKMYLNENNKPDLTRIKQNAVSLKKVEEAYLDNREKKIAEVLQRTLNAEQITPNDNIFFIGGTSLLILIIRDELEKEFQLSLAVEDLYIHPTVRELSTFIGSLETVQDERLRDEFSGENKRS